MGDPESSGRPTIRDVHGRDDNPAAPTDAGGEPPQGETIGAADPAGLGETVGVDRADATVDRPAPTVPAPASAATLGRAIPGYEIVGELGRGGMGVVYEARQLRLNRACALKMILAGDHAGPEAAARFVAEAETVARLRHPGIVQIYGIGDHDGRTYIELEYVEGGSLADRLDGTPWPPRRATELLEALAGAMAEAHRLGIVHRDLKPANVLIGADGAPKVTDFGLAKSLDSHGGLTRTASVLGTPSYMAPEQAEGGTRELGPSADVYSLGAILYELLTGRPPFRGATILETLAQVKAAEPVAPSRLVPGLPRDVETICLKCLQKDPVRRYPDAQALAEDLRRFLAGEPIVARPIGVHERAVLWVRKRPAIAGLLGLVVFVAALGLAGIVWQWDRAQRQRDRANEARARAERQKERAERFARRADEERARSDRRLYAANIALAYQEWLGNGVARAEALLGQTPGQLRGWEWGYLSGLCRAERMTLRGHDGPVVRVAFPGGGRVVTAGQDRAVRTWDAATGQLLRVVEAPGTVLAISADGRRLAAVDDREPAVIRVIELDRATESVALRGHGAPILHAVLGAFAANVALSPDGRTVVSGGADRAVRLWDAADGRERNVLRGHRRAVTAVAISPDGATVASAGGGRFEAGAGIAPAKEDAEVLLWDAATGKLIRRLEGEEVGLTRLAFDPAGRRVAGASFDDSARVWDRDGTLVATLRGHRHSIVGLAFTPDGRRLATASLDRSARLWDVASGRDVIALRGHADRLSDVAFAPDGAQLVTSSADGTARVWDVGPPAIPAQPAPGRTPSASQEYRAFTGGGYPTQAVDLGPDGTRLAAGDWEGRLHVWDLRDGRELRSFLAHDGGVASVHFRPDGQELVTAGGGLHRTRAGQARVWSVGDGRLVASIDIDGPVAVAKFSPDGRYVALATGSLAVRGAGGRLKVVEPATGREVVSRPLRRAASALDWSPDGGAIATAGHDGQVHLWDATSGTLVRSFGAPATVFRGVAFSPVGGLIAATADGVGGSACPIVVWDAATGGEVRRLPGHPQAAYGIAFSPDGRRIASASTDTTVKLWDLDDGLELLTLRQHTREAYAVAFGPGGRHLASAGGDGAVLVRGVRPAPAVSADDWPVVFADDFQGRDSTSRWDLRNGLWRIEAGALRGETRPEPGGGGGIGTALAIPRMPPLPPVVDVRLDCWSPLPVNAEVKFHDEPGANGLGVLLLGVPNRAFYAGDHAGLVLEQSSGRYATAASDARFQLRPETRYRVRVLRLHGSITAWVDGAELVSAPVTDVDAPVLHLQASLPGDDVSGRALFFDNVEVRIPQSAGAVLPSVEQGEMGRGKRRDLSTDDTDGHR